VVDLADEEEEDAADEEGEEGVRRAPGMAVDEDDDDEEVDGGRRSGRSRGPGREEEVDDGGEEGEDDEDDETERIPPELLTRVLHEFFERDGTRITRDANAAVARYMDVFVREAIARAAVERDGGFLEVSFANVPHIRGFLSWRRRIGPC
jgi:hypothetical protein